MGRLAVPGLGLVLLLGFSACASRPPQPAMVAQAEPGGFGYSETKLGAGRSEVHYITPELPLPADEGRRLADLTNQKQRAYDLALWRAAQIAMERGFGALTVEQDHRDADVVFKREAVPVASGMYGPYGLYPGWGYGRPYCCPRRFATPFWFYNDPFAYETRVSVSGRIDVSLLVAFARTPVPGSLDPAATVQRLAKQYAGVSY